MGCRHCGGEVALLKAARMRKSWRQSNALTWTHLAWQAVRRWEQAERANEAFVVRQVADVRHCLAAQMQTSKRTNSTPSLQRSPSVVLHVVHPGMPRHRCDMYLHLSLVAAPLAQLVRRDSSTPILLAPVKADTRQEERRSNGIRTDCCPPPSVHTLSEISCRLAST